MINIRFNEVKEEHLERLEQYTPIVARVHGGEHPEFHEVHRLVNIILERMERSGDKIPALDLEFEELRDITNGYQVPEDTCESYEAVYHMLEELDKAYQE